MSKPIISDTRSLDELFDNGWEKYALRIPEYQRRYEWGINEVNRVIEDLLRGLGQKSTENFTFFGAIVLCARQDLGNKSNFSRPQYDVVDGQQRITTTIILTLALHYAFNSLFKEIKDSAILKKSLIDWLDQELDLINEGFENIVAGTVGKVKKMIFFERIVKNTDERGNDYNEQVLNSDLAKFLNIFVKQVCREDRPFFDPDTFKPKTDEGIRLKSNFDHLRSCLNGISDSTSKENIYDDFDFDKIPLEDFGVSPKYKGLCNDNTNANEKLNELIVQSKRDLKVESFLRQYLLAKYFYKKTYFTIIFAENEKAAFDIFDSLNTTGLPLTAIETLRPAVQEIYSQTKSLPRYEGSDSQNSFNEIEHNITERSSETSAQHKETKHIVRQTALVFDGKKIGDNLNVQRTYLRELVQHNKSEPEIVIEALKDVSEFRNYFYTEGKIQALAGFLPGLTPSKIDEIQLFSSFLLSSKTQLHNSILTAFKREKNLNDFYIAFKKFIAFFVLKRATTQGTGAIDSLFRNLMNGDKDIGYEGLKIKGGSRDLKAFQSALISMLNKGQFPFTLSEKEEWVKKVSKVDHFTSGGKSLIRFMLLASHQHSHPSASEPGLLTREGHTESSSRQFLSYNNFWKNEDYKEIEHVAPQSGQREIKKDYEKVFETENIKHSIGNFVLLPKWQNASLKDIGWQRKKLFFNVITTEKLEERKNLKAAAQDKNIFLPNAIETKVLNKSFKKIEMSKGIEEVVEWNAKFIEKRSTRLVSLVWDLMEEWIKE